MASFISHHINRVDSKGRVSVPASFRAVLAMDGTDRLYAYPSLDHPAIDAGGERLRAAIEERLAVFETFSEDYEVLATAFYGESRELRLDQDGRIVLPEEFKSVTGIEDQVCFVGQGFKFQLWEPRGFAARKEEAKARLREVSRSLGGQRSRTDTA